jgi:transcriptional regulator with XRE-family HTH domain
LSSHGAQLFTGRLINIWEAAVARQGKSNDGGDFGVGRDSGFARRLAERRERLGYSQEALAQKTGLSKNSIQNYEAGRLPSGSSLVALCQELGLSSDFLLFGRATGGADPPGRVGAGVSENRTAMLTPPDHGADGRLIIPEPMEPESYLYALVPLAEAFLSAGGGAFVPSERATKFLAFRRDWLNNFATSLSNVVLMFVQGNSMWPTFEDGDMVMLDHGRRIIHDGALYAIGLNRTISIKRLKNLVGGRVRVISDNKDEYEADDVPLDELQVIGQIIWFARELIK